jgi:hypothetical protein
MARPIAYSYARFSTPEQERGDSERRQIEAARQDDWDRFLFATCALPVEVRVASRLMGTHRKRLNAIVFRKNMNKQIVD